MQVDDFLFGDEESETDAQEPEKESNFKQLRSHANKLEKTLKQRDTELEELRAFKVEADKAQRTASVQKVFSDLNLPPAATKFWSLENPDSEPDATTVGRWAVENGFAQGEPVQDTGFTPTSTPEGIAPGAKRYSRQEWLEMTASDPAEAQRVFKEGRVDLSGIRQGLGPEA